MIVSCPECHTLYRHRIGGRRTARCGACHTEIVLPSARTYVVQTVEVPVLAGVGASPATSSSDPPARSWKDGPRPGWRPAPEPPAPAREHPDEQPDAGTVPDRMHRRLDEMVRSATGTERAAGSTLRTVLFGVGFGTIAGLVLAPEVFHAPWAGWAAGGVVGGALGALWSRVWGLRSA